MKVEQKLKDILLSTATDENGRCWIERYIKVIESFKDNLLVCLLQVFI